MPLTAELAAAVQKATVRSAVVVYGDLRDGVGSLATVAATAPYPECNIDLMKRVRTRAAMSKCSQAWRTRVAGISGVC